MQQGNKTFLTPFPENQIQQSTAAIQTVKYENFN